MRDASYQDLESFRGIELETEIERLMKELQKKDDKVTSIISANIDLFSRWSRGQTFKEWQEWKKAEAELGKRANLLRARLGM